MMAVAMTAMVACGEKDDPQPTPGDPANNDTSLVETTWHFAGDEYTSDITFKDATKIYHHEHYSDGTGTITLMDVETDETVGTATFSISGTMLTLQMLGATYTLALEQ